MTRTEIYATFALTSKMILLAAKRIVPTVRRRKRDTKSVLIVHHRDVVVDDESSINANKSIHRHVDPDHPMDTVTPLVTPPRSRNNSFGPSGPPGGRELPLSHGHHHHPPPLPTPPAAESLQVIGFSGSDIDVTKKSKPIITKSWDSLSEPKASEHLSTGGTYFKFVCRTIKNLDESDRDLLRPHINRTIFKDEAVENGVPYIDIDAKTELFNGKTSNIDLWTFIGVRTTYILPGMKLSNFTKDLLSSKEYHRECQPGPPKVHDDCTDIDTVRFTKTVVRFVFVLTLQLRVSEINDPEILKEFEHVDGMVPAKVILMERTKRNVEVKDSTAKCKSLLLYYPITGGVLVTGLTMVINRTIPRVIASIVNSFGGQGAAEAGETADKTRKYLLKTFGDARAGS